MLSTLEPDSAYSAFNLNLVSELAPLHLGEPRAGAATHGRRGGWQVDRRLLQLHQLRPDGEVLCSGKAVQVDIRLTLG